VRILICHNFYQQPGGEDEVFADEGRLLEERGHEVVRYTRHNDELRRSGRFAAAADVLWSRRAYREIRELVLRFQPEVTHFHNTFPLISPAGYYAAQLAGGAVVQTLHNYRMLCPNALFFRDGKVCEDCMGKLVAWPGVLHRCYRGSAAASGAVAAMLAVHHAFRTWSQQVDMYIALTEFARRKFLAGGLPPAKVVLKPNFLYDDPGVGRGTGGYALFVGRLSPEKGIETLLNAWAADRRLPPLRVAGGGPMVGEVQAAADAGVLEYLGRVSPAEVAGLMADAACLVFPSEWYETFGRVVIEALAAGTPVVVSGSGAAAELIEHGSTGAHFRAGDPADLADKVLSVVNAARDSGGFRAAARNHFLARYSAEANNRALLEIYHRASASSHGGRRQDSYAVGPASGTG
jgi:glycosyltransferase involved in cell wall biosynthesis